MDNCVRSRINASAFGIISQQQDGSSIVAEALVYMVDGGGGSIRRSEIMAQLQFVMIDCGEKPGDSHQTLARDPPTGITSSPIAVVDNGDCDGRMESTAISKFLRELRILSPFTSGRRLSRRRPYVNDERVASTMRNGLATRAGERSMEADDDCCTLIDYSNSTTSNSEGEDGHGVGLRCGMVVGREIGEYDLPLLRN